MQSKILIIEDNLEMRENIEEILELSGYDVESAENGKEGVKLALSNLPDLVICDVMMPIMDGYETLYVLSKNPKTSGIPFVFLTAKSEKDDWRKGMNLGADDYIMKPFNDMELLTVVETRLKKNQSIRSLKVTNRGELNEFLERANSLEEFKSISEAKKGVQVKKKEIIFREGDVSHYLYFVGEGKVRTFKMNEDSKEYTTGLFKQGDFFGSKSLLQEIPHTESAVALEDSEIVKIHKDDFLTLIHNNQEVSSQFIKILASNLLEKEQELLELAYNSVRKRVADGLLLLQEKYQEEGENQFSISIPRDGLASIVGTSTESVIRVLSDFKSEKLIEIKASNITILDSAGLTQIR